MSPSVSAMRPAAPADWTDAQEAVLLDAALARIEATQGGSRWDAALFRQAAADAGLSPADADLLAPNGARDLAALLWRRHDQRALAELDRLGPPEKVRDRIQLAVQVRLRTALANEPAVRAASLFLGHPAHGPTALRLGWATADGLWRWAGDTSTDENHYSKRAILAAMLASTLAVSLTRGEAEARAHLRKSIDQVMAFERFKAKLPPAASLLGLAASSLGRLRYGPARTGSDLGARVEVHGRDAHAARSGETVQDQPVR